MKVNIVSVTYLLGLYMLIETEAADDIVETRLGKLQGYHRTSRSGRKYLTFSGVPYAKPPLGNLRFRSPVPASQWEGVRQAIEDGPYCIQYDTFEIDRKVEGVEDCLYLTVYTHNVTRKYPVIVHFHKGGFRSGNGARLYKPTYLMDQDVVVVDVNYRLGIFGFLSFEDEVIPGNQGMKDQTMALKWVQENIASFGGDPQLVTIFGESAGGMSVCFHLVSPLSRNTFHRAIAQGGSCYGLQALTPPGVARRRAQKLLRLTDCDCKPDSNYRLKCLQSINATDLVKLMEKFVIWQVDPVSLFVPVLEENVPGSFLVGPVSKWKFASKIPLLIGTTSAEGYTRTKFFLLYKTSMNWLKSNFRKVAPISLLYFTSASDPDFVTKQLMKYYFPRNNISWSNWKNLTEIYTDDWYRISILMAANKYSKQNMVYFYYFDYVGEYSVADEDMLNRAYLTGAPHTEENIYLWYNKTYAPLKGEDLKLSQKMVKMWTDFAKYGNPTPAHGGFTWDPWNKKRSYLYISKNGFKIKKNLAKETYRFWQTLPYRDKFQ